MTLPATSEMVPKEEVQIPNSKPFGLPGILRYVQQDTPLVFLRFFDGEFHSMFGTAVRGRSNADGHKWMEDTMGAELRKVFEQASGEAVSSPAVHIEIAPCWTEWQAMRDYVMQLLPSQRAAIDCGRTWVDAIKSGDIFEFLSAVRWAHRRTIMVGREDTAAVATVLGAIHVPCPFPNAYNHISKMARRIRAAADGRPYMLLSSIGMATEPLLWRLWTGAQILIDWGHVPDALLGLAPRNYLRKNGFAVVVNRRFLEWARKE